MTSISKVARKIWCAEFFFFLTELILDKEKKGKDGKKNLFFQDLWLVSVICKTLKAKLFFRQN